MTLPETPKVRQLSRDDVIRRLKALREGLQLSRREFGEVDVIAQKGRNVVIHTSNHTLTISIDLWEDLGRMGEQAVIEHKLSPGIN